MKKRSTVACQLPAGSDAAAGQFTLYLDGGGGASLIGSHSVLAIRERAGYVAVRKAPPGLGKWRR